MTTLTLQVESPSVLAQLKVVLKTMKGVRVLHGEALAEEEIPNAVTLAAMKEAESGRDAGTVSLDSLESFIASME